MSTRSRGTRPQELSHVLECFCVLCLGSLLLSPHPGANGGGGESRRRGIGRVGGRSALRTDETGRERRRVLRQTLGVRSMPACRAEQEERANDEVAATKGSGSSEDERGEQAHQIQQRVAWVEHRLQYPYGECSSALPHCPQAVWNTTEFYARIG